MPSARVIVDINLYIMWDGLLDMKEWEVFYHICEPSKFDNNVPVHEGNVLWPREFAPLVRVADNSKSKLKEINQVNTSLRAKNRSQIWILANSIAGEGFLSLFVQTLTGFRADRFSR